MRKLSTVKGKEIYDFTLSLLQTFTTSLIVVFCLSWLLGSPFTYKTSLGIFTVVLLYDLGKFLSTEKS